MYVFNFRLNTSTEVKDFSSNGSSFHNLGPTMQNDRSAAEDDLVKGTLSRW